MKSVTFDNSTESTILSMEDTNQSIVGMIVKFDPVSYGLSMQMSRMERTFTTFEVTPSPFPKASTFLWILTPFGSQIPEVKTQTAETGTIDFVTRPVA